MARWEEAQPGQVIQTDQSDIPYIATEHHVQYVKWGDEGERGDVQSEGI